MESLIIRAKNLAAIAHAGQTRKYTNAPYIVHPIRVAGRVLGHAIASDITVSAALLHDVLEDTDYTEEYIDCYFGSSVTSLVKELTNPSKGSKLPRDQRKRMDREHLQTVSREAKIIKLFDRIDNLNDMKRKYGDDAFFNLYCEESLLLLNRLNGVDAELEKELYGLAEPGNWRPSEWEWTQPVTQ